jgi:hypothetical protein
MFPMGPRINRECMEAGQRLTWITSNIPPAAKATLLPPPEGFQSIHLPVTVEIIEDLKDHKLS